MDKTLNMIFDELKIKNAIEELCDYIAQGKLPNMRYEKVIIRDQGHFEVILVGWRGNRHIHNSLLHIDIENEQIVLHYNGTDIDIAEWLEARGISRKWIYPAYLPPHEIELLS